MAKNGTKKTTHNTEEVPDELEDLTPPLPPDGGWGWAVVAASFLVNFIVDGVCYTFGVILPELVDHFETSKGKAALVGSMVPGVYLIVGPIVSALANKFGCKIVAIIGSAIAGVFFALSQLSPNIDIMILTYGVMGGIGFGMMYLPSIVMVGYYFDKKRALATGIAVCGSGIGTFVMAPLAGYLVREYGWKGANFIIGAIVLHGIAFGMIYRPLIAKKIKPPAGTTTTSPIFRNIIEEKRRRRTTSTGSLDGTVITRDNKLVVVGPNEDQQHGIGLEAIPETVAAPVNRTAAAGTAVSGSSTSIPQNKALDKVKYGARTRTESTTSQASRHSRRSGSLTPAEEQKEHDKLEKQMASPFAREDIFFTGSVTSLHEFKASPDMATYVQSHTSIPGVDVDDQGSVVSVSKCAVLQRMFDFSLLKSPTFILITLAGVFTFIGLYTPFVYVYEKAVKELGVDPASASIILSILGIFNTLGRLAAGFLADRPWADALVIHNVSALVAGGLTCLVSFMYSYALLCAYAVFFGIFIAAFIALRSIVVVELLGIQKLTNAFGLMSLFQGFACLIGSPLAGALLESTGSFVPPFMVAGTLMILGGVVCLPVRRVALWENRRNQKQQYKAVPANRAV